MSDVSKIIEPSTEQRPGAISLGVRLARTSLALEEGFRDYDEKILSVPAFQAHPLWHEPEFEVLIAGNLVLKKVGEQTWQEIGVHALTAGGKTFIKTGKKGPSTITAVVKWFEKNHPEEAQRLIKMGKGY